MTHAVQLFNQYADVAVGVSGCLGLLSIGIAVYTVWDNWPSRWIETQIDGIIFKQNKKNPKRRTFSTQIDVRPTIKRNRDWLDGKTDTLV